MLFTGIILTNSGPKVLEYNVRFGDPETQTLIPLLSKETDLAEIMTACCEGRLDQVEIKIDNDKFSVVVILAAAGYPGLYNEGSPISLKTGQVFCPFYKTPAAESIQNLVQGGADLTFFHAGTRLQANIDNELITASGRVMAVNATANTLLEAVHLAYSGVNLVEYEGKYFRGDIAHRFVKRCAYKGTCIDKMFRRLNSLEKIALRAVYPPPPLPPPPPPLVLHGFINFPPNSGKGVK